MSSSSALRSTRRPFSLEGASTIEVRLMTEQPEEEIVRFRGRCDNLLRPEFNIQKDPKGVVATRASTLHREEGALVDQMESAVEELLKRHDVSVLVDGVAVRW